MYRKSAGGGVKLQLVKNYAFFGNTAFFGHFFAKSSCITAPGKTGIKHAKQSLLTLGTQIQKTAVKVCMKIPHGFKGSLKGYFGKAAFGHKTRLLFYLI
jgi:hypothetical protein